MLRSTFGLQPTSLCKMKNQIRVPVFREHLRDRFGRTHVSLHKGEGALRLQPLEIFFGTAPRQVVHHHYSVTPLKVSMDRIGPDEAGTPRNDYLHILPEDLC